MNTNANQTSPAVDHTETDNGTPSFLSAKNRPAKPATLTSTKPVEGKAQAVEHVTSASAHTLKASELKPNRAARRAAAKSASPKPAKVAKAAKAAKPAVSAATDKPAPEKRSIVPASFKAKYAEHNDTCGSTLSLTLKEATSGVNKDKRPCLLVPELFAIAKANGIDTKPYADLNNGQKRMNVYNRLVGLLNDGKDVRVGKKLFKAADHKPTTQKPAKKAAKSQPAQQHAHAA